MPLLFNVESAWPGKPHKSISGLMKWAVVAARVASRQDCGIFISVALSVRVRWTEQEHFGFDERACGDGTCGVKTRLRHFHLGCTSVRRTPSAVGGESDTRNTRENTIVRSRSILPIAMSFNASRHKAGIFRSFSETVPGPATLVTSVTLFLVPGPRPVQLSWN
jgi:hypothetical protein